MPENLFWRKETRLIAFLLALVTVLVIGITLYRNTIVSSLINYSGRANSVAVDCLEFDLQLNLSVNISELCLKHPKVKIELRDANWNIWSKTLLINTLIVNHLDIPSDTNQSLTPQAGDRVTPPLELPGSLPLLDIKRLVINSPLLDAPVKIQLTQTTATSFQILGNIRGEIALKDGKILAELTWLISDLTQYFAEAKQNIADYSGMLDINAMNQTTVISKIEYDGQYVRNSNKINLNNTLSLNNCQIPFSVMGDISINTNIDDISAEIDLSTLDFVMELQQCQTLMQIPELSNFQRLLFSIPYPLNFRNNKITLRELNAIAPGATQSSLKLLNLSLGTDSASESVFDYELSLNPVIEANLDFKEISYLSTGKIAFSREYMQLHTQQNKIKIIDSSGQGFITEQLEATIDIQLSGQDSIIGNGQLQSSPIKFKDSEIGNLTSTFKLTAPNMNDVQINVESHLNNISYSTLPALSDKRQEKTKAQTELTIRQLSSNIDLKLNAFNDYAVIATTNLNYINLDNFAFTQITINHDLQGSIAEEILASSHDIVIDEMFSAKVEQQQRQFQIRIDDQNLANLQDSITTLVPELTIADGQVSASIAGQLNNSVLSGQFQLNNISATFQDYQINEVNYHNNFSIDSAGLQLDPGNMTTSSVDAGIQIHNIQASISASDSQLKLENISGEILGGNFSLNDLWLDGRSQSIEIKLNDIELAKLVKLQQQSGIEVTGQVKGSLPIQFNKDEVIINSGT
ncbi:MAG: hypothetical protein ACI808_002157, partial [Paraglaciecola sp.]